MTVKIVLALWFTISKVFFSSLFRWPNNRFWPFPKQIDFAFYFQTRSFTVIKYSLKRRRFFMRVYKRWRGFCGLWNGVVGVCVFFFFTWFMWHMLAVFLCKVSAIDVKHLLQISHVLCDLFLLYFFFFIFFKRENFTHICWKKGTNRQKKGSIEIF